MGIHVGGSERVLKTRPGNRLRMREPPPPPSFDVGSISERVPLEVREN